MKLIVGLGNPGKKYQNTRHNLGFEVIQPIFSLVKQQKFDSLIAKQANDFIIALPQTYMNNSGDAVSKIANYYKIKPADIWIIHDDVDLPLGTIRLSKNSSSAGHKGVTSVINALGTKDFYRFRLGILTSAKGRMPTESFVLQKFSAQEKGEIKKVINKTRLALLYALKNGIETTNQYLNNYGHPR